MEVEAAGDETGPILSEGETAGDDVLPCPEEAPKLFPPDFNDPPPTFNPPALPDAANSLKLTVAFLA